MAFCDNKEILEKAIQKAIDGGWGGRTRGYQFFTENKDAIVAEITNNPESINDVIFSHDFAKALWRWGGKAKMHYSFPLHWGMYQADDIDPTSAELEEWQYHLQMMVVSDDPIKYLGENI